MKMLTESTKVKNLVSYLLDFGPYDIEEGMFEENGTILIFKPSINVQVEFNLKSGKTYLKFDKNFCVGLTYETNLNTAYSDINDLKEDLEKCLEVEDEFIYVFKYKSDIEDLIGESGDTFDQVKDIIEKYYEITSTANDSSYVIVERIYKINIENSDNNYKITGVEFA